jgi:kynureninase
MTEDAIKALDENDPLRPYRARFDLPSGVIYLDGNSLGPPPRAALERLQQTASFEWRQGLIASWNDARWIDLSNIAGAKIARLIGVAAEDVIVADSVSVNIFKFAAALSEDGRALCVETGEFPTDGYVLSGLAHLADRTLSSVPWSDAPAFEEPCVLVKSLVHYKTAALADIAAWESAALAAGASIIWDLSHATGVIDCRLKENGARYAVGCSYKYLNGGPGAPSFVYVASPESERLRQPIAGWMGHAAPFDFSGDYVPAPGVKRFAAGTPPILSLAALDAALDVFKDLDMRLAEEKARALADLFLQRTAPLGLEVASVAAGRRGGHVCLEFNAGYAVVSALIARGVIGDFRAPDLMRFGFSPLFLSFDEVARAADHLSEVMKTQEWRDPAFNIRKRVT